MQLLYLTESAARAIFPITTSNVKIFGAINGSESQRHITMVRMRFAFLRQDYTVVSCLKNSTCPVVVCDKAHHELLHHAVVKAGGEILWLSEQACDAERWPLRGVGTRIVLVRLTGPNAPESPAP